MHHGVEDRRRVALRVPPEPVDVVDQRDLPGRTVGRCSQLGAVAALALPRFGRRASLTPVRGEHSGGGASVVEVIVLSWTRPGAVAVDLVLFAIAMVFTVIQLRLWQRSG